MDTPERAASLADSNLSDAINKSWLISSSKSFKPESNKQWNNYSTSSNGSSSRNYGALSASFGQRPTSDERKKLSETSWLLRHYWVKSSSRQQRSAPEANQGPSINSYLYDNISFAEPSISIKSCSEIGPSSNKGTSHSNSNFQQNIDWPQESGEFSNFQESGNFCFGKFRIFLSCYLLLGLTLAIYSRNALSLAVVGMVANNEINNQLVNLMALQSSANDDWQRENQDSSDGTCPVESENVDKEVGGESFKQREDIYMKLASTSPLIVPLLYSANLPEGGQKNLTESQRKRALIEKAFRASVRQRVEAGELVDWTPGEQGFIFAAGSVGNLLIAIPLTRIGEIYGSKWIIFAALAGATIQAGLMPLVSPCNLVLNVLFQVIFCGLTYGADCIAYTFFAHWLTPNEMTFFVSCLLICYQLGNIISNFVTASILTRGLHWSWCFYVPAILCGLWTLIWPLIGANEPKKSWLVSRRELSFLIENNKLSQAPGVEEEKKSPIGEENSISWMKLAKDPNVWAVISIKFTLRWYFSVYASLMPTYLSSIVHMSVKTIGNMSVIQSFICLVTGILLSYLTKSSILNGPYNITLASYRKIAQSIVCFGLSTCLIFFIIFDCNQLIIIIALTISGICINFYVAGALQLPLDLSAKHCGLITSISNTLALGQALGAPISGLILDYGSKNRQLWRIVWGLSATLNLISGLLFIVLVDAKPRDYEKKLEVSQRGRAEEETISRR